MRVVASWLFVHRRAVVTLQVHALGQVRRSPPDKKLSMRLLIFGQEWDAACKRERIKQAEQWGYTEVGGITDMQVLCNCELLVTFCADGADPATPIVIDFADIPRGSTALSIAQLKGHADVVGLLARPR